MAAGPGSKLRAKKAVYGGIVGGLLTALATLIALYFNYVSVQEDRRLNQDLNNAQATSFAFSEKQLQVQQAMATRQVVSPTPESRVAGVSVSQTPAPVGAAAGPITSASGPEIPFAERDAPETLAGRWQWLPGTSADSTYRVSAEDASLTLITGPGTDLWGSTTSAPSVETPIEGDFQVTVKLNFQGKEQYQIAGLGIRSVDDPRTWVAARRIGQSETEQLVDVAQSRAGTSDGMNAVPYAKAAIYLRVQRVGERFSFAFSENGTNWFPLKSGLINPLAGKLNLFLFVYSTTQHGILAQFSDLRVTAPAVEGPYPAPRKAAFSAENAGALSEAFGWYPGGSASSAYRLADGRLTLIAGPHTDFWGSNHSGPWVEIPVSGNFVAQVKMSFQGGEEWQVAGFGMRSGDDLRNWIVGRRASSSPENQLVEAVRNLGEVPEPHGTTTYADPAVYLRIRRQEPTIDIAYSPDGVTWKPLVEKFVMGFPETNAVILFVYSTSGHGVEAVFSELSIEPLAP